VSVVVAKRPTALSSALAVLAVAGTAALVGTERSVRLGLGVELVGLLVVWLGFAGLRRDHRALGAATTVLGAGVVLAGLAIPVVGLSDPTALVDAVPGLLGVAVVGTALAPLYGSGSRWVLRGGVGLAFVAVLASAVVQETAVGGGILAATCCVVGWDLGENAITLGRQLGRSARTYGTELTHAAGTAAVGVVGVELLRVVADVRPPGASLETLVVLVLATLLLVVALYE